MKTLQEDESVQQMGVVRVSYLRNYNPTARLDIAMIQSFLQLMHSIPLRFAAIYVVTPKASWDAAITSLLKMVGTATVVRTRLLTGKTPNACHVLSKLLALSRGH